MVLPIHILICSTLPYFLSLCGTVEVMTFKLPIRSHVVVVAGRVDTSRARYGDGDACSYESGFGEGRESEISRWFRVKGEIM